MINLASLDFREYLRLLCDTALLPEINLCAIEGNKNDVLEKRHAVFAKRESAEVVELRFSRVS